MATSKQYLALTMFNPNTGELMDVDQYFANDDIEMTESAYVEVIKDNSKHINEFQAEISTEIDGLKAKGVLARIGISEC